MKLLFVSNFYPPIAFGGYEHACFDVAEALRRRGHQVFILTSSFRAEEVAAPESGVYRLLKLRWSPNGSNGARRSGVASNRLEADWHNARTVRQAIERLAPDLVVIFNGANLGRTLIGTVEAAAPAVVYRVSDQWLLSALSTPLTPAKHPSRRRLYEAVLAAAGAPVVPARAHNVAFNSQSLRAQYEAKGCRAANATVIYPGIPTDLFAYRPPHILRHRTSAAFSILYVGRICPAKGVATLIHALGRLRSIPGLADTRLTLIGPFEDDSYKQQLQALAARLGIEADFAGVLARSALPAVYAGHDLLAFPSEWDEPFGLTLVEAMATGLPVVTTLRGGASEIACPGRNATAFKPGDAGDLAEKMAWTLTHPRAAAAMAQAASEDIIRRFPLSRYAESLEKYFADLPLPARPSREPVGRPV